MNLASKYIQDKEGVKIAPITTPQAVRWANGDNLQDKLDEKQDIISDLATIRNNATNALKPSQTSGLVRNDGTIDTNSYLTQHQSLQGYATEQWVSNQGYLTSHQDISGKEDRVTVTSVATGATALSAEVNNYYTFVDALETMAITLPTITDLTKVQSIVFFFTAGTTPAITFTSSHSIYYHDGFEIEAGSTYEVNALFNGSAWVIASVNIVIE